MLQAEIDVKRIDVNGDWRATLDVGMAKLRIQLHVSKDAAGAYSAKMTASTR